MVSGSAALPVSTLERWREITGHTLLERYGMTEIGMAFSNPYRGSACRAASARRCPRVRFAWPVTTATRQSPGSPGEIEVRGPSVFLEYWRKPDATREAFRDGWFRTGDTAVVEQGGYRILGRTNIDILKTGGHKVSALEIEEVLRQHPAIAECAVVGVPDPEWGERVAAASCLSRSSHSTLPASANGASPAWRHTRYLRVCYCCRKFPQHHGKSHQAGCHHAVSEPADVSPQGSACGRRRHPSIRRCHG